MSNYSTFVIDIDDTISKTEIDENGKGKYSESKPIKSVVKKIRDLWKKGHRIILFTARGMRTFDNDVQKIEDFHRKNLENWLKVHNIPYNELVFGKPWGNNVFYVDDKNLSINQFLSLDDDEYFEILKDNKL